MTNPAHTPVALDEKRLVEALEVARHNTGDIGKEIAIRAYLSAVGGEAGETGQKPGRAAQAQAGEKPDFPADEQLGETSPVARLKAQPGVVKALEWPALKTALWRVVMDAEINAHYIYAYDFTEKLYQAALAAPVSQPANPAQVTDAMVEAARKAADDALWKWRGIGERREGEGLDGMHFVVRAALTAAIGAGRQAVVVKALEWSKGVVDRAIPLPGMKYVACSTSPEGAWAWWLEEAPETRAVFSSEQAAKAAAQADYERRILSALASPTDVDAAVEWRSMDSAPKDGTWIIAYRPRGGLGYLDRVVIARWDGEVSAWVWPDQPFDIYEDDYEERLNSQSFGDKIDPFESNEFTHWTPLPTPPLTAAKAGEDGR